VDPLLTASFIDLMKGFCFSCEEKSGACGPYLRASVRHHAAPIPLKWDAIRELKDRTEGGL
jgi:hypothetical protein